MAFQEVQLRKLSWNSRWHHQMETFSALLGLCAGNSQVTGEFPSQRPVTQGCFFDLRPYRNQISLCTTRLHYSELALPQLILNSRQSRTVQVLWYFTDNGTYVLGVWYTHDDVIKWKHFPRHWPFVRGIHRSPVNSPQKGKWRGALMFTLICVWINGCVNNREAGDFKRYFAHYGVTVILREQCYDTDTGRNPYMDAQFLK